MTNRRDFLKTTMAFTAGTMVLPMISCNTEKIIGLQLYSVRDKIKKDLDETLAKVAQIGYNSVEAAGFNIKNGTFYDMPPKEFAEKLKQVDLTINSSHTGFALKDAEKVFECAAEVGTPNVIFPYLGGEYRKNIDGYKATAETFNKIGEIAKKYDIRFGYHNHAFEFKRMDNQIGMDVLIEETDPEFVTFELDLYWVTKAGYDPVEFIKKHPGRFEIFHVKDMAKTEDRFFAPVGQGRIDFERIFSIHKEAGTKLFFVEQDSFKKYDSLESVKLSYDYLNKATWLKV